MSNSELHGFEAAWDAFQNCPIDGALDDEDNMRAALRAALAIAPQAPVSAVPVAWLFEGDGWGREVMLSERDAHERKDRLSRTWNITITPLYASPPPPAQADDWKDAEIVDLEQEAIILKELIELKDAEIERLKAEIAQWEVVSRLNTETWTETVEHEMALIRDLVAALDTSVVAINDWLNIYAEDECNADRVAEAKARVLEHGTLAYIAEVQEKNRAALTRAKAARYSEW